MYEKNSTVHLQRLLKNTGIAKELNTTQVLDKIQDRLPRIIKKLQVQKAERSRGDNGRGFWTCETGTGQQVAQSHDS
jgi:hypothetical protein